MRMIQRAFFLLAFAAVAALPCTAADLTLDGARSAALANSKALARLNLATDAALLDEKAQKYAMLPSLSLSASASMALPSSDGSSPLENLGAGTRLGVSQTLWNGGQNTILAAIDAIGTGIAREAARSEYFRTLDSVDAAYYAVLKAESSLAAAETSLASSLLALSIAQTRFDSGAISATDWLEAESGAEAGKTAVTRSRRDLALARAKLASITGLTGAIEPVDFSAYESLIVRLASYGDAETDAFIEKLRAAVKANNPDIASSRLSEAKAEQTTLLGKAGYLPTVSASWSGGIDWRSATGVQPFSGSLSISGSIPLDVWDAQVSAQSKEVARKQAILGSEETARTVDLDLQTAALDCIAQARSVISSRKALEYAQKLHENKLELYRLNSASTSDLSGAEALLGTNTKALIEAQYGFLSCLSAIRSQGAFASDQSVVEFIP